MASSTEWTWILVLGLLASGCLSGHLLDAGHRREIPVALTAVTLDGDDLVVTVRTQTVTDLDRPVGRGMTRARVALADLGRGRPVDDVPVRFESPSSDLHGRPLLVLASDAVTAPPPLARLSVNGARSLTLVTRDVEYPPLYLEGLTRHRYAPWTWVVMPAAVAADVVVVPPLLLLAPAVMVIGE